MSGREKKKGRQGGGATTGGYRKRLVREVGMQCGRQRENREGNKKTMFSRIGKACVCDHESLNRTPEQEMKKRGQNRNRNRFSQI
jgi:hypothetical protein